MYDYSKKLDKWTFSISVSSKYNPISSSLTFFSYEYHKLCFANIEGQYIYYSPSWNIFELFKLWVPFQSHAWIHTGITVRKPWIQVKICDFLSRSTSKCDRWNWKTIGHLFYMYATSNCVHHFVTIGEIKLELRFGSAQIGAKFVLTSVTLTFDLGWTWVLSVVITSGNFMMIRWQEHCVYWRCVC